MRLPKVPIDQDITLEIPMDDTSYTVRVAKDIVLDEDNLKKTIVKMEGIISVLAASMASYDSKMYLRKQNVGVLEQMAKTVASDIYTEIRDNRKEGDKKLTEKEIEARVLVHQTYKDAQAAVEEGHEAVARMIEVIGQTKSALEKARNVREDAIKFYDGPAGAEERRPFTPRSEPEKKPETEIGDKFRGPVRKSK